MEEMMDRILIQELISIMEEERKTMATHLSIVDDMMDEILILENPESMREVALFVKGLLRQMERI